MQIVQKIFHFGRSRMRFLHQCIPGTQMTPFLIGKGLLLEGSSPKIEDKQVPDRSYIYIYYYILKCPVLIAIFGSFPVSESFLDIAVNANARRFKQAGGFSRQIWRWSLVVLGQYGPLFPITPKT